MAYENEKQQNIKKEKIPTRMGFEPTRAEPNGLAVHRLNHSATSSYGEQVSGLKKKLFRISCALIE